MSNTRLTQFYKFIDRMPELDYHSRSESLVQLRDTQHPLYHILFKYFSGDSPENWNDGRGAIWDETHLIELLLPEAETSWPDSLVSDLRQLARYFKWDANIRRFLVGTYQIVDTLSVEPQTASYLCYDQALNRNTVLTLAYPRVNANPAERNQFIASAKTLSAIFHPNVAAVLSVLDQPATEEQPGLLGLISQWVAGETLSDWLKHHPSLPLPQIASIMQSVAEGIVAIHSYDWVHGRIDPQHVMIRDDSTLPVILTFDTIFENKKTSALPKGLTATHPSSSQRELPLGVEVYTSADNNLLGTLLQDVLRNGDRKDHDTDGYRMLQTIADRFTDPIPTEHPDIYHEVLPIFSAISGRPVSPLTHDLARIKRSRQKQSSAMSRRLLMLAGSTLLPFFGMRVLHDLLQPTAPKLPFIPGTTHDIDQAVQLAKNANEVNYITLDQANAATLGLNDVLEEFPGSGIVTIPPFKLTYDCVSKPFVLPDSPVRANIVSLILLFNAPPGDATCEFLVRNTSNSHKWLVQAKKSNYIGGPLRRTMSVAVERDLMKPGTTLEFCIRLSTRKAWDGKGRAPIMFLVKRRSDLSIDAWPLLLWTSEF